MNHLVCSRMRLRCCLMHCRIFCFLCMTTTLLHESWTLSRRQHKISKILRLLMEARGINWWPKQSANAESSKICNHNSILRVMTILILLTFMKMLVSKCAALVFNCIHKWWFLYSSLVTLLVVTQSLFLHDFRLKFFMFMNSYVESQICKTTV